VKPKPVRLPVPKRVVPRVDQVQPQIVTRDLEPKPQVSKLPNFPAQINLPVSNDTRITTLLEGIQDADLKLFSLSENLEYDGRKLTWNDHKVDGKSLVFSGLTVKEDKILFR